MELRYLRYFVAVAHERHFTKAAKSLGISQPPLSQQIKRLEEEVGTPLFRRLTRGVELTEAGEAFYEDACKILAMSDAALDRFWWPLEPSRAGLLDALENHLDPAHPHFVHPWLVRPPTARRTTWVDVRSGPWGAEARYIEQRANRALLSAVMEGERRAGIGRLWPPTCGEVRLENTRGAMLSIAVVFSPLDHDLTRPYAHFASTRGWLPAWFKRAALKLFHMPVLAQDRRMLGWQVDGRGPGGFVFGPMDVLARAILRHAHGETSAEEETSFELEL